MSQDKSSTDQPVSGSSEPSARQRLVGAGIELIRAQGYSATSVEQICSAAGLSKGAFFHHFKGKEALAEACIGAWGDMVEQRLQAAAFMQHASPVERLRGCLDHFITLFEAPGPQKSCLVGTTVQETAQTHPQLRTAAGACFGRLESALVQLLEAASASRGRSIDSVGLARLYISAMQGGLILQKAGAADDAVPSSLRHVRDYILSLLLLKQPGAA